ncbi:MAG TPA: hypothetical protein PKI61_02015 [bacterium]|nr:hypothetical protein [bacterium]HPT29640.1 hypothetical protein [bacterium]
MKTKGIIHIEFLGFLASYNHVEPIVVNFLNEALASGKLQADDIVLFNSPSIPKKLILAPEGKKKIWRLEPLECIRIYCLYSEFPIALRRQFRRLENIAGNHVYFIFLNDYSLMPSSVRKKVSPGP